VVDERCREAPGERVQDILDRVRGPVAGEQHGRLVVVEDERLAARVVLLARAVERLDLRAVVPAAEPVVARAELEAAERRVGGDGRDGVRQRADVDAVDGVLCGGLHDLPPWGGSG
jgi:hypothetical protein